MPYSYHPPADREPRPLRTILDSEQPDPDVPALQRDPDKPSTYRIVPDIATRRAACTKAFDASHMLSRKVPFDDLGLTKSYRVWPRRLLHVKSMTSVETAGLPDRPRYNILSYTWGRWQQESGPSLPIKGTTWRIPSVRETCFTVEQFTRVIKEVASKGNVEFVWLDVACIDQENVAIKMDEIGKQAGIFAGADLCFVWLHGLSIADLKWAATVIDTKASDLVKAERKSIHSAACTSDRKAIRDLSQALEALLENPWFSSLWTLQEAYFGCKSDEADSGQFLSTEGRGARIFSFSGFKRFEVNLPWLRRKLADVMRIATRHSHCPASAVQPWLRFETECERIGRSIEKSGILSLDSPLLLYTVAGSRQTTHPLDRIYGIMQIFDLKLGQANDGSKDLSFSLQDLEKQMAIQLNILSVVRAQLFTHAQPPAAGQAWCISQSNRVPRPLRAADEYLFSSSLCSITYGDHALAGQPKFRGRIYTVDEALAAWAMRPDAGITYSFPDPDPDPELLSSECPCIVWDAGAFDGAETLHAAGKQHSFLSRLPKDDYELLLLGLLVEPEPDQMPLPIWAVGVELKPSGTVIVGLIARKLLSASPPYCLAQRVGVMFLSYDSGLITEGLPHDFEERWLA